MLALYNGFVPASSTSTTARPPTTAASTSKSATQTVVTPTVNPGPTTTFVTSSKPVTTSKSSTTSSVVSTPTTSWTDLGCYTDSTSSRGLTVSVTVSGGVTPASCRDACSAKGYSIAGVEYGAECWCGSSLGKSSVKAKEGDCNMKCAADASQTCGAGDRLNVYAKGPLTSTTNVSFHNKPQLGSVLSDRNSSTCASKPTGAPRARTWRSSTRIRASG